MPNEMQLIETDGTPKHEMQKRALISDGGITRLNLTPSKRETVHNMRQRGHFRKFINKRMKIYIIFSHNGYSTNDPPCSLNRDHGPIGCHATDQVSVIPRRE